MKRYVSFCHPVFFTPPLQCIADRFVLYKHPFRPACRSGSVNDIRPLPLSDTGGSGAVCWETVSSMMTTLPLKCGGMRGAGLFSQEQ